MGIEIVTKDDLQIFRLQLLEDFRKILDQPKTNAEKSWLRSSEVRQLIKISPGTLQNLRITGKLNPTKLGGILYYSLKEVHSLLPKN
jgi:hypothetical protein